MTPMRKPVSPATKRRCFGRSQTRRRWRGSSVGMSTRKLRPRSGAVSTAEPRNAQNVGKPTFPTPTDPSRAGSAIFQSSVTVRPGVCCSPSRYRPLISMLYSDGRDSSLCRDPTKPTPSASGVGGGWRSPAVLPPLRRRGRRQRSHRKIARSIAPSPVGIPSSPLADQSADDGSSVSRGQGPSQRDRVLSPGLSTACRAHGRRR